MVNPLRQVFREQEIKYYRVRWCPVDDRIQSGMISSPRLRTISTVPSRYSPALLVNEYERWFSLPTTLYRIVLHNTFYYCLLRRYVVNSRDYGSLAPHAMTNNRFHLALPGGTPPARWNPVMTLASPPAPSQSLNYELAWSLLNWGVVGAQLR